MLREKLLGINASRWAQHRESARPRPTMKRLVVRRVSTGSQDVLNRCIDRSAPRPKTGRSSIRLRSGGISTVTCIAMVLARGGGTNTWTKSSGLDGSQNIAITLDLSERKVLEDQFRQAQKMEAVGRLAGGIAHDVNNVLSVIPSYAEMIGGDLMPDEPIRADIEEIRTAALRATALTRQLLAFSRQQVLDAKVLDMNQSVAAMEKMLGRLLGADIELTLLPAIGLWNVKADPGQIEQILMNLAVNARDAMPQGGKLAIETENVDLDDDYARAHHDVRPGSDVMLAVTDTGIGWTRRHGHGSSSPSSPRRTKEGGPGSASRSFGGMATSCWRLRMVGRLSSSASSRGRRSTAC